MHCCCVEPEPHLFPTVVARTLGIAIEQAARTKVIEKLDTVEAKVLESTRRERKGNGYVKLQY